MLRLEEDGSFRGRETIAVSEIEPGSLIKSASRLVVVDGPVRFYFWLSNFALERLSPDCTVFKDAVVPRSKLVLVPSIEIPLELNAQEKVLEERAIYSHNAGDTFFVPSHRNFYVIAANKMSAINLFTGRIKSAMDINALNKIPVDLTLKVKHD